MFRNKFFLGAAICAILFLAFHVILAKGPIEQFSPTYDEPVHLTAGYVYIKTQDYRMNGLHHPPFGEIFCAAGLLKLNPFIPKQHTAWISQIWDARSQYRFADAFFYQNRVPAETMLQASRWRQVIISLFLGIILGLWAWRLGGFWALFFGLLFWAFSPSILAHATLVTTDLPFAFFYFLCFFIATFEETPKKAFLWGLAFGMALSSKFFSVAILPHLFLLIIIKWMLDKSNFPYERFNKWGLRYGLLSCLGVIVSVGFVYQFKDLDLFKEGMLNFFLRAQSGRSSFFWGEHRTSGWLAYFPTVFLLKTPLPLLITLLGGIILALHKKIKFPLFVWGPPFLFLLTACLSKVQIGHRYILVLYPFLFLMAGLILSLNKTSRIVGGILGAWLCVSSVHASPHFLSYFNELVGGAKNGYLFFTDSNVDWGQGLKLLSQRLSSEQKQGGIYLSYFGVADPHDVGITYLNVASDAIAGHRDDTNRIQTKPTLFAISVTNLQSTYYSDKDLFSWLKDYTPVDQIAYSIFLYDFSDHPEAIKKLETIRYGYP